MKTIYDMMDEIIELPFYFKDERDNVFRVMKSFDFYYIERVINLRYPVWITLTGCTFDSYDEVLKYCSDNNYERFPSKEMKKIKMMKELIK